MSCLKKSNNFNAMGGYDICVSIGVEAMTFVSLYFIYM